MKNHFEFNPFKATASSTIINHHSNSQQGDNKVNCSNRINDGAVTKFDKNTTVTSTAQQLIPTDIRSYQNSEKSDEGCVGDSEEIFHDTSDYLNQVVPQTRKSQRATVASSVSQPFFIFLDSCVIVRFVKYHNLQNSRWYVVKM